MSNPEPWTELSCGACGGADMRLRGRRASTSGRWNDVACICVGCGSVTHIVPRAPEFTFDWGRKQDGERDDGLLCAMPWKAVRP